MIIISYFTGFCIGDKNSIKEIDLYRLMLIKLFYHERSQK